MIPLGGKASTAPTKTIDPEPFDRKLLEESQLQEVGRGPTKKRHCNVIDIGFRNEAGFPLSVYWARQLEDVPTTGFTCAERYKFHMGNKAATQDFMWDWNSKTKYEGALIGHTFVARKADDPSVVVDKYTLEPTRIIDCPRNKNKQVLQIPATTEIPHGEGGTCPNGDIDEDEDVGEGDDNDNDNGNDNEEIAIVLPGEGLPRRAAGAAGFGGISS